MLLKSFELKEGNFFIAMEYYGLILNRTFLVIIFDDRLIGLKVNGIVSAPGGINPLTIAITNGLSIQGNLNSLFAYAKHQYVTRLLNEDLLSDDILKISAANFRIFKSDISDVRYDARKKMGMGPYPHDGKVYITAGRKRREFIIVGAQSGKAIERWIMDGK